jgi:hypothetical protein
MPVTRKIALGIVIGIAAFGIGMAGATLFHPDDGPLLRSTGAWQVFGLTAYAGMALLWLSIGAGVVALAVSLVRLPQRRRRAG